MQPPIYSKDVQNFLLQNKSAILSFFKSQEKEYMDKSEENATTSKRCYKISRNQRNLEKNTHRSKFKLTSQPGRVVGVFGLSQYTDESDLLRIFQEFGKVEKIHIIRDRYNQRSRGFGFVYLRTKEEAENAIRSLSNSIIDGHKVRIDFSNTI